MDGAAFLGLSDQALEKHHGIGRAGQERILTVLHVLASQPDMYDKDLITLRGYFCEGHIDRHELDELNFRPVVYQRILFMEEHTRQQARERLAWLWDQIRAVGYDAGNRSNMAVLGYPLTQDLRHWEVFADVSKRMATVAVDVSAALIQTDDGLNRAITAHQEDQFSYVLPNIMLVDEGGSSDRFSLFMSRSEILSCGARNQKINLPVFE